MKKTKLWLSTLLAVVFATGFVSCGDDDDKDEPTVPVVENELKVSASSLLFSAEAGEKQVLTITCTGEWTAMTNETWIDLSPKNGDGNGNLTITINSANSTSQERVATVIVTSEDLSREIIVTQKASLVANCTATPIDIAVLSDEFAFGIAAEELKLIVSVLVKSLKSMFYNGLLFLIFIYLYAVAGVSLFRLPDPQQLSPTELQKYEQLMTEAPHSPVNSPDPFGTIGEAFFTLFRALTGEDWTDLRYNLITASNLGVIDVNPSVITVFLVSWFCIAAFLLLNLVTGAVINNYQNSLAEVEERKKLKMKATESTPAPTGEPVAAEIEVEGSGN